MTRTCFLRTILVVLAALSFGACAGADCSKGKDYCEGNVAWACVGGGDQGALKWQTSTCGEDAECKNGVCFSKPVLACPPERIGTWGCHLQSTYPGLCTEAGYWAWDLDRNCDLPDFQCNAHVVKQDGVDAWMADCVMMSICSLGASAPAPSCHNDVLTVCTALNYQTLVKDCAAEGKVCLQGECSAVQ
jgi:hypothetical protein